MAEEVTEVTVGGSGMHVALAGLFVYAKHEPGFGSMGSKPQALSYRFS